MNAPNNPPVAITRHNIETRVHDMRTRARNAITQRCIDGDVIGDRAARSLMEHGAIIGWCDEITMALSCWDQNVGHGPDIREWLHREYITARNAEYSTTVAIETRWASKHGVGINDDDADVPDVDMWNYPTGAEHKIIMRADAIEQFVSVFDIH